MPDASGRYRILIVDDEPPVNLLLRRILVKAGYDVTVADDTGQALRFQADAVPFDLLLTDVMMPEMGGDELVTRMRATQPELRALYVTGLVDRSFRKRRELDNAAFLEKPISVQGLLEAVSLALFGHTHGLQQN